MASEEGGSAGGGLGGFVEKLEMLAKAYEALQKALEVKERLMRPVEAKRTEGANLERLSKRTGLSVGASYRLEEGFQAAGLGADRVEPLIVGMERALAGLTDKPADPASANAAPAPSPSSPDLASALKNLGLNKGELNRMTPYAALSAILEPLSKKSQTDALTDATQIVGQDSALDLIQLARSLPEEKKAMRHARPMANEYAQSSATFAQSKESEREEKQKHDPLFMGLARILYSDVGKKLLSNAGEKPNWDAMAKSLRNPKPISSAKTLDEPWTSSPVAQTNAPGFIPPAAATNHFGLYGGDSDRQVIATLNQILLAITNLPARLTNTTPLSANTNKP